MKKKVPDAGTIDTLRTFLDEPSFIHAVGTANIPWFEAVLDLAESAIQPPARPLRADALDNNPEDDDD
jgi:hypothetical protein